jgi:A/G-specific adenine glycosylase
VPSTPDAEVVQREILDWYALNSRELPWRTDAVTPWGVFVSEVMSQQTPVARVAPAWEQWLQRWPTPCSLAAANPADVIRQWGTLGYPRRALWLRDAARRMCEEYDNSVPRDYADLLTLPGVGDYTAASVSAFAYRQATVVLDTNVRRVLARIFLGVERPTSSSATKAERLLARELLPSHGPLAADWAVASMEFGSLVCKAAAPNCPECPVRDQCSWVAQGSPPNPASRRKSARFEGTDRQVRGKILAVLRTSDHDGIAESELALCWGQPEQYARALESLVSDGLVELAEVAEVAGVAGQHGDRSYRLPH